MIKPLTYNFDVGIGYLALNVNHFDVFLKKKLHKKIWYTILCITF
jgi:hypothetical protein